MQFLGLNRCSTFNMKARILAMITRKAQRNLIVVHVNDLEWSTLSWLVALPPAGGTGGQHVCMHLDGSSRH